MLGAWLSGFAVPILTHVRKAPESPHEDSLARETRDVSASDAARAYLAEVRQIRASGHQTDEQSFYPPLNHFIDALLDKRRPALGVLNHPHAIQGDLPDLALYEVASNVLVLPLEGEASVSEHGEPRRLGSSPSLRPQLRWGSSAPLRISGASFSRDWLVNLSS